MIRLLRIWKDHVKDDQHDVLLSSHPYHLAASTSMGARLAALKFRTLPDTPETGGDSGVSGDAARICGLLWFGFGYLPICRKDCLLLNV